MRTGRKAHVRKVLFASKLVLALLLGHSVIRMALVTRGTTELFGPASAVGGESSAAAAYSSWRNLSLADYSSIVQHNIFRRFVSPLPVSARPASWGGSYSMSSAGRELGLVLTGTVAGNPLISRAIIKDLETNISGLYRPGDTVAAANIETIETDRVVLRHQGQRKLLSLGNTAPPEPDEMYSAAAQDAGPVVPAIGDEFVDESPTTISAELSDVDKVLRKAVIKPHMVDGRMDGIRITGLEGLSAARALALKNGDIIVSVNGHRLTSKQKAYQILKKARSQPVIDIELLRGNRTKTLTFLMR
jgi:type II secretion system protein C